MSGLFRPQAGAHEFLWCGGVDCEWFFKFLYAVAWLSATGSERDEKIPLNFRPGCNPGDFGKLDLAIVWDLGSRSWHTPVVAGHSAPCHQLCAW